MIINHYNKDLHLKYLAQYIMLKIKYMKNHHNNFTKIDGKVWKEKLENS